MNAKANKKLNVIKAGHAAKVAFAKAVYDGKRQVMAAIEVGYSLDRAMEEQAKVQSAFLDAASTDLVIQTIRTQIENNYN